MALLAPQPLAQPWLQLVAGCERWGLASMRSRPTRCAYGWPWPAWRRRPRIRILGEHIWCARNWDDLGFCARFSDLDDWTIAIKKVMTCLFFNIFHRFKDQDKQDHHKEVSASGQCPTSSCSCFFSMWRGSHHWFAGHQLVPPTVGCGGMRSAFNAVKLLWLCQKWIVLNQFHWNPPRSQWRDIPSWVSTLINQASGWVARCYVAQELWGQINPESGAQIRDIKSKEPQDIPSGKLT